jgi:chemotaxis protein histidine kinase CheA
MNQIESKVRAARRRLILTRFGRLLSGTLAISWLLAGIAIAARSIWVLPWDNELWAWAWLCGSTVFGLTIALTLAIARRPSLVSVATEVDQRYEMKQRLGSVLAMREDDLQSPMGQALVSDAAKRAEQIDLHDRFPLAPSRLSWLPLLPALLLAIAWFAGPAAPRNASAQPSSATLAQAEQVKKSTEALKKKLSDQRKKAEAAGLKDAAEMFTKLEAKVDKMAEREAVNPKEAMIAMNDLKKQLDERRKQLGDPDALRQTLAKMNESEKGPAESIVKAMKEGDFGDAKEKAKALAEKIRSNNFTPEQKAALEKQVQALRDQLKQAAEKHEEAKQQLKEKIEEAKREGRGEEAAKLQQQMNELEGKDAQMQKMQQMAESMSDAAEAMAKGDAEQAAEAMEGMADQMGEMQEAMEQLQDIEETLDTLSEGKDQMLCKKCSGQGCESCKGNGQGKGEGEGEGEGDGQDGDKPGKSGGKGGLKYGLGKGSGLSGPEEEDKDTQSYESQVRGDPKKGRGMNAGFADGPNRKGVTREEVKQAVLGAISEESDPLENQNLPRSERDHAREYFDKLRSGK